MRRLINNKPVLIPADWEIDRTLKEMIKRKISCVLVYDSQDTLVGIVTERDILRKIATLDVDRKLHYKINTIMTRAVDFCQIDNLTNDVIRLHEEKKIRHFPVVSGASRPPSINQIIGIITMTDLGRKLLDDLKNKDGR